MLRLSFIDVNKKIILDREGKKYFGEIIQKNEYVELFTEEININDKGLIEHTDIFSWALYLPQTSKTIYVDKKSNTIQGSLLGMKGQYLLLDQDRVFNVRAHQGYIIELLI